MKLELPTKKKTADRMPRETLLVLLPEDPRAPVDWWRLDAGARVLDQGSWTPGSGKTGSAGAVHDPRLQGDAVVTVMVAIAGPGCAVHRVEVRAHSMAQAAAAARATLAADLASGDAGLHVAVAAQGNGHWLAVVSATADMEGWLARVRALGLAPDQVVPAALLLEPGADGTDPMVAAYRGAWLCRDGARAFIAEAELARAILGVAAPAGPPRELEGAMLAAAALAPPINLLQGPFAPAGDTPRGAAAWRRAAVLAALVCAALLLAPGIQAGLHQWHAGRLLERAGHEARQALPGLAAGADAPDALRERLAATRNVTDFSAAASGLMAAVEAVPGASLDALSWREGRLRATVGHGGAADIEALRAQLDARGFGLVEEGTARDAGGEHLRLSLEPLR